MDKLNEAQKKGQSVENAVNVADMKVTFDDNGKVLKVHSINPDKLVDISTQKDIIKHQLNEELTEIKPSEMMEQMTLK